MNLVHQQIIIIDMVIYSVVRSDMTYNIMHIFTCKVKGGISPNGVVNRHTYKRIAQDKEKDLRTGIVSGILQKTPLTLTQIYPHNV